MAIEELDLKILDKTGKEAVCGYLRTVSEADCRLLFDWANDPEVRKNSFSTEPIPYEIHVSWFQRKLEDSACMMFIYMVGSEPAGQVRVELENGAGLISYSIAKEFRGKGYGKKMLLEIEEKLVGQVEVLNAQVKTDNKASQFVFERLGYQCMESDEMLVYKKWLI